MIHPAVAGQAAEIVSCLVPQRYTGPAPIQAPMMSPNGVASCNCPGSMGCGGMSSITRMHQSCHMSSAGGGGLLKPPIRAKVVMMAVVDALGGDGQPI